MDYVRDINEQIENLKVDTNQISDGYHTFEELYEHRIILYTKLCEWATVIGGGEEVWRTKTHSDGSVWEGWFLLGIGKEQGEQITYHLPEKYWNSCNFAETLEKAPEFDGHTPQDVLERIKNL